MKGIIEKGEYISPQLNFVTLSSDVLTNSSDRFDNVVEDPGEFTLGVWYD